MSAYGIIEEQVAPNTAPDEWIKQKCELRKEKNYLLEILPQLEVEQKRHRHRKIFAMVRRIARRNKKLWRRIYRTKFGIKIIPPEI